MDLAQWMVFGSPLTLGTYVFVVLTACSEHLNSWDQCFLIFFNTFSLGKGLALPFL